MARRLRTSLALSVATHAAAALAVTAAVGPRSRAPRGDVDVEVEIDVSLEAANGLGAPEVVRPSEAPVRTSRAASASRRVGDLAPSSHAGRPSAVERGEPVESLREATAGRGVGAEPPTWSLGALARPAVDLGLDGGARWQAARDEAAAESASRPSTTQNVARVPEALARELPALAAELERAAATSFVPKGASALFELEIGEAGEVVRVAVVVASSDERAFRAVADEARASLERRKRERPPGGTRSRVVVRVEVSESTVSGRRPERAREIAVFAPPHVFTPNDLAGRPFDGHKTRDELPPPNVPRVLSGAFDLADVVSRPRRTARATVISTETWPTRAGEVPPPGSAPR